MALRLAAVGKHIEVQIDGSSPNIVHQSCISFDQVVDTGVKVKVTFAKPITQAYNYNQIYISGVACSSYSDFKTKLAAILT